MDAIIGGVVGSGLFIIALIMVLIIVIITLIDKLSSLKGKSYGDSLIIIIIRININSIILYPLIYSLLMNELIVCTSSLKLSVTVTIFNSFSWFQVILDCGD